MKYLIGWLTCFLALLMLITLAGTLASILGLHPSISLISMDNDPNHLILTYNNVQERRQQSSLHDIEVTDLTISSRDFNLASTVRVRHGYQEKVLKHYIPAALGVHAYLQSVVTKIVCIFQQHSRGYICVTEEKFYPEQEVKYRICHIAKDLGQQDLTQWARETSQYGSKLPSDVGFFMCVKLGQSCSIGITNEGNAKGIGNPPGFPKHELYVV